MSRVMKTACVVLVLVFVVSVIWQSNAVAASSGSTMLVVKAEEESKVKQAEALKAKREAAAKAKREEAARRKARAEAKARAKREAQAKARADRERQARLKRLYAKAKAEAKMKIAQAQKARNAKLKELAAREKRQTEKLTKEVRAKKAALKSKYEKDKAQLRAEHKKARAEAMKNKAQLDAEYKKEVARLEADYRAKLAKLAEKEKNQKQAVAAEMSKLKKELAELQGKAKVQAKESKAQMAGLKRAYEKDLARIAAERKQAIAEAKKRKADKKELARLEAKYRQMRSQRAAQYKTELAKLQEQSKTEAQAIAQAISDKKAAIAELDDKAKTQAREIKSARAELTKQFKKDKAAAHGLARLDSQYESKLAALEADYLAAVGEIDGKVRAQKQAFEAERARIEADYDAVVAKEELRLRLMREKPKLEQLKARLPKDETALLTVKELRIGGNILVPTSELFDAMPLIYNASDQPIQKAASDALYDFSVLRDIILEPGTERKVSARTIQGFTRYILSVYQEHNYAGIYVYVPAEAMAEAGQLKDGILQIQVLEAPVTEVSVKMYDPDQNPKKTGYLKQSFIEDWSPIKVGQVANQKELDDYVNLLNLNPDRYVSAVVTKGSAPQSLAVAYDVYEANPWHFFVQADNSGTRDRKWSPRVGIINTNLLGIDDTFTAIYQAPWEKGIEDEYSVFGSYDFPLVGPRLRLNIYGGYSQFDTTPAGGGIDFFGSGSFVGGILRWNVYQTGGWFFDLKGLLNYERSKTTPSLFPSFLGSDVRVAMIGWGAEVHRSDDLSNTRLSWDVSESFETSDQASFSLARTGAPINFRIYNTSAEHSQFLDPNKVHRITGTFRWIDSSDRLIPAKMTAFGGLYSVRGYEEYDIIADGGILASLQYEFDIVKYQESLQPKQNQQPGQQQKKFVKRVAPLVFWDYGKARIRRAIANEEGSKDLWSLGAGVLAELGDNFSGGIYYGFPMTNTDDSHSMDGRWHISLMYRW